MKRYIIATALIIVLAILSIMFAREARAAPPLCIEGFTGKSAPAMPRWERGTLGHHVYWYCLKDDGGVIVTGFSCPHGVCDIGKFSTILQDITVAPDKVAAVTAAWNGNFAFECSDAIRAENSDRGRLCVERRQIYDANKAVWNVGLPAAAASAPTPPASTPAGPIVWRALGSAIYTLTAGKLSPVYVTVNGKLTALKASLNSLCDGAAPFISGTITYMPLMGGPATQVTSCKKATQ